MVKKKQAPAVVPEAEGPTSGSMTRFDPGADWQVLDLGEGRRFWLLEDGGQVQGVALGIERWEQDGEPREAIKLQLTRAATTIASAADGPEDSEAGTIVLVDVKHALQGLAAKIERSPVYLEILLSVREKVSIRGGKSVYRIAQAVRATKKTRTVDVSPAASDADAPF